MKGMAIIVTIVGVVAGTVSAVPLYKWTSVDLGNGLYGYSFWCDNQDWPTTPWFIDMEWQGVGAADPVYRPGTIQQVQAFGSFDVHLEAKADDYDAIYPASGYRKSQDSWIRADFSHAIMSGTPTEGPNRYYVESGTEAGVRHVTVPHAYIVCDGDVAFNGQIATSAGLDQPPFWTPVSGVAYPKPAPEFYAVLAGSEDGWIRGDQDATALRDVLLKYGGVNPENIRLELSPNSLSATIQDVRDKLEPGDTFLVYFSGHGTFAPADDSEPEEQHSALAESLGAGPSNTGDEAMFFTSDSLGEYGEFSDDTLTDWLSGIPDVHKIVLMDGCFSGGFWGAPGNYTDQGDLDKLNNVGLLASCPSGDLSFSMPGTGRSFFSIALEGALDPGPGGSPPADANGDGRVSFGELEAYMDTMYVAEELGDTGVIQAFPWLENPLEVPVDSLELYTTYGTDFNPHAPIPEPAGLLLIALGALALIRRRTEQVLRLKP